MNDETTPAPESPTSPEPDPATIRAACDLVDRALTLAADAEANRLRAYIAGGRLVCEAKARVGHGHWLLFIYRRYQQHRATIWRMVQVADAVDGDAWLAAAVEERPTAWGVRRVLEYAGMRESERRDIREDGVLTDFRGTRVPIEQAPTSALRHHKRVVRGKAKAPPVDPVLAELAKGSRFVSMGAFIARLRALRKDFAWLDAHTNLSPDDPPILDALQNAYAMLHDFREEVEALQGRFAAAQMYARALGEHPG